MGQYADNFNRVLPHQPIQRWESLSDRRSSSA